MLNAHDKVAVLTWSERQLGAAAKRAAIVELDSDSVPEKIEKGGTGILQYICLPFLSVMADSIQRLAGDGREGVSGVEPKLTSMLKKQISAVH